MALRGPRSPAPNHCNNTKSNTSQKQDSDLKSMVIARLGPSLDYLPVRPIPVYAPRVL